MQDMMRCPRCSGLIVKEYFCGGETVFGAWSYEGVRCVNCGAIVDREPPSPVIQPGTGPRHRRAPRMLRREMSSRRVPA
jgi:hypothetical protein